MLLGAAIVILYTVRGHVPKEARRCRHADSPRIHVRKWLWHPASCFCFPECASHACMLLLTAVAAGDLKRFVDCIDTRNAAHCQHATSSAHEHPPPSSALIVPNSLPPSANTANVLVSQLSMHAPPCPPPTDYSTRKKLA
ncbi:hypothetical protein C9890_0368 [Perkinsus sp. BL_2016]|nr:hypothetical protein C9890_0368 [Perkinsus sp. BL_2016]